MADGRGGGGGGHTDLMKLDRRDWSCSCGQQCHGGMVGCMVAARTVVVVVIVVVMSGKTLLVMLH